jgi:hypothetical protein
MLVGSSRYAIVQISSQDQETVLSSRDKCLTPGIEFSAMQ